MKNCIIFLANSSSIHVKQWIQLNVKLGNSVNIFQIRHNNRAEIFAKGKYLIPKIIARFLPKKCLYFLSGLVLRFYNLPSNILHAHNASGYGLMAWLSGKKYILTIYGSEIYSAKKKGLYYYLLRKILNKAELVTVSTPYMKDYLSREFNLNACKIYEFSLGVPIDFIDCYPTEVKKIKFFLAERNCFYILSNRRIHPHYNIAYLIKEFAVFLKKYSKVSKLILVSGDFEPSYLEAIYKLISDLNVEQYVYILDDFISQTELAWILNQVDISVSLANSDQLSSSILESLYSHKIPVLNNLPAYTSILEYKACYVINNMQIGVLANAFEKLSNDQKLKNEILSNVKLYKQEELLLTVTLSRIKQVYKLCGLMN